MVGTIVSEFAVAGIKLWGPAFVVKQFLATNDLLTQGPA
jgi:hypothetical protein